jgi:hypothetical protein
MPGSLGVFYSPQFWSLYCRVPVETPSSAGRLGLPRGRIDPPVAGLSFGRGFAISGHMVLRSRPRRKAQPRTSLSAHNAALHFLARPKQYPLTEAERADLIQVVEGFTGPHDHEAARRGVEWMRPHLWPAGATQRF